MSKIPLRERIQAHLARRIADNDPLAAVSREEFEINSLWFVVVEIAHELERIDGKLTATDEAIAGVRGALDACLAKLDEVKLPPERGPVQ